MKQDRFCYSIISIDRSGQRENYYIYLGKKLLYFGYGEKNGHEVIRIIEGKSWYFIQLKNKDIIKFRSPIGGEKYYEIFKAKKT